MYESHVISITIAQLLTHSDIVNEAEVQKTYKVEDLNPKWFTIDAGTKCVICPNWGNAPCQGRESALFAILSWGAKDIHGAMAPSTLEQWFAQIGKVFAICAADLSKEEVAPPPRRTR